MKRATAVVLHAVIALGLLFALASPAAAQQPVGRDPFDAVVTADEGGGTTGEVTGEVGPIVVPGTDTGTDPLPTTGADPRSWLALAYILVAVGAGTLLTARVMMLPPQRARRRNDAR